MVVVVGAGAHHGEVSACAGGGLWVAAPAPFAVAVKVPGTSSSEAAGCLAGILTAVDAVPPYVDLTVATVAWQVIDGLTMRLPGWENRGWFGISDSQLYRAVIYRLRRRSAPTTLEWIPPARRHPQAREVRLIALEAALSDMPATGDLEVPPQFRLTGVRLASLTQALAYRMIRAEPPVPMRQSMLVHLDIAHHAVHGLVSRLYNDANIWASIRRPEFSKQFTNFLWKALHGAHWVGSFWLNVPHLAVRGDCRHCGGEESLEHILIECTAPGRREVWCLAEHLWLRKHHHWPQPSLGGVLGCGLASFSSATGQPRPGASRLYRILVAESTYLIWKLRCERVITHGEDPVFFHTDASIRRKWAHALNGCLGLDQTLTHRRYGRRALSKPLVLATWSAVLKDEAALPEDWILSDSLFQKKKKKSLCHELVRRLAVF
ncbi:hypothetical protein IEO21_10288 [Rhodonia placenta]|uniref:Reverse transcriptase zinc-binding domain-containing protein n=1 Tax=Rhodonia placenta TaxID=104341 RepID=A0A8H7NSR0_9APHY|nr:hypothetical protein IEO21_10288 [Postia placenta]